MTISLKPLQWSISNWNRASADLEYLKEVWEGFGAGHIQAWIEQRTDGKFYSDGEQFNTLDAAKAYGQTRYERLILSAIEQEQELVAFDGLPKRKLGHLTDQGYRINGYAVERDGNKGFITDHGFVGWWRPDTSPSVCEGKATEEMRAEAIRQLQLRDERDQRVHDIIEELREMIYEMPVEDRPAGLFQKAQDAVYGMRGRVRLMDDAAITAALSQEGV